MAHGTRTGRACQWVAGTWVLLAVTALPAPLAAAGPTPPEPVVTVTPDSDLFNAQRITVEGAGFEPDQHLLVAQCPGGGMVIPYCSSPPEAVVADAVGSFTVERQVRDSIYVPRETVDCRGTPSPCPMVVASVDAGADVEVLASAGLALRLEGDEHVGVTPHTDLVDGEEVAITGSGLNANHPVYVGQCRLGGYGCSGEFLSLPVDPDGDMSGSFVVQRSWRTSVEEGSVVVDCALEPCAVVFSGDAIRLDVGLSDAPPRAPARVDVAVSFMGSANPAEPVATSPAFTG